MRQATAILSFDTPGRGFTEITRDVAAWLEGVTVSEGLLTLLCRHTSASLLIQENAAPAVRTDLARWLDRLAPGALDFWPGPGPRTLPLPSGFPAVGPLICYEVIFDGRVTEAGYRPAWLLNVSNDAWFAGAPLLTPVV